MKELTLYIVPATIDDFKEAIAKTSYKYKLKPSLDKDNNLCVVVRKAKKDKHFSALEIFTLGFTYALKGKAKVI